MALIGSSCHEQGRTVGGIGAADGIAALIGDVHATSCCRGPWFNVILDQSVFRRPSSAPRDHSHREALMVSNARSVHGQAVVAVLLHIGSDELPGEDGVGLLTVSILHVLKLMFSLLG